MTHREQRTGKAGENLVASVLSSLGVDMIERIGTPVKLIPTREPGAYRVIWSEPVSGDHRGILPGGRSVLAETKTILDRNLRHSDLRPHQPARLTEHHERGGLSLLVWVHTSGIYVMSWPIVGFEPGVSISPDAASKITMTNVYV